jgi:hypothetical protein
MSTTDEAILLKIASNVRLPDAGRLLCRVLDEFRDVEKTTPLIMALNKTGTRYAIIFMLFRLCLEKIDDLVLAVPVALATSTAACARRLWVLTKSDTSESALALVGQGYYFGDQLRVDDEVMCLKSTTVVGRRQENVDAYDSAEEWADHTDDVEDYDLEWDIDGGRKQR